MFEHKHVTHLNIKISGLFSGVDLFARKGVKIENVINKTTEIANLYLNLPLHLV